MKIPLTLNGESYKCKVSDNTEIVKGSKGKYFYINLYGSDYQQVLTFPSGSYIIADIDKYKKALSEFGKNIVDILRNSEFKGKYQIFVKGSADYAGNENFSTTFNDGFRYSSVCFYPRYMASNSLFTTIEKCVSIVEPITNEELPNLRAAFIQEKIENFYTTTIGKPIILEGSVTLDVSEVDRNVTLLLFLPSSFFK